MDIVQRKSPPPSPAPPPPRPSPPPPPPPLNLTAASCTRALSQSGLWGLDSLDRSASALLDSSYTWAPCTGGTPTHVFMIDTGIYAAHTELSGRVSSAATCTVSSGCSWADDNGHGTHCSGIAGGQAVGVDGVVTLHAVKVLSSSGSGSVSAVAAGVNWVAQQVAANAALRPAVVSMSLGGGLSSTIDNAVKNLVAAGVPAVVAAGNSATSACSSSPADVATAITVAAADSTGAHASFSNYGSCVDVYAPGVGVYSSVNTAPGAYATWSGTSMATPHVAGTVALMLSAKPCLSPAELASLLVSTATPTVTGVPAGTTNRLVLATAAVRAAAAATCASATGVTGRRH